jgi:hypothetical protein
VVLGVVRDTAGQPVPAAEVVASGTGRSARTDAGGAFRLAGLAAGQHLLQARRVGYAAATVVLRLGAGDTADVELTVARVPYRFAEVVIEGGGAATAAGRSLAGFAERMRASGNPRSKYLTRRDLERLNPTRLSDALRRTGLTFRLGPTGHYKVTNESRGVSSITRQCTEPLFYVNGLVVRDLDLDALHPSEVEAVEVYLSSAAMPAEFNATGATCGAVVLWLRR